MPTALAQTSSPTWSASRAITKVGWGFNKCNEHCVHCYNSSDASHPTEHTPEALFRAADLVFQPGTVQDVNYGSGELIVNPHGKDLIEYVHARYPHVRQALTSNGFSVLKLGETLDALADVDVSLDVPDAHRHNRFRGHAKAYDWVLEALELLRARNMPRTVVTCITSETTDADLEGLLRLADAYGALWRLSWYRHTGRGADSLRITSRRAWDVIDFLSRNADFVSMDSVFAGVLGLHSQPCPAGKSVCRIQEDLTVTPYPFLKGDTWKSGDLTQPGASLDQVLDAAPMQQLRARKPKLCSSCPFFATCQGGCASRAYLHRDTLDAPDDFCPLFAGLKLSTLQRLPVRMVAYDGLGSEQAPVHSGYLCTTIVRPRSLSHVVC